MSREEWSRGQGDSCPLGSHVWGEGGGEGSLYSEGNRHMGPS